MKILIQLLLLPVDLVFLTIDAWIITFGWMKRVVSRDKDQPCHLCRGEDHSSNPHPVRSVLKYRNGWLVTMVSPCIRFRKEAGKRMAFCKREGGFVQVKGWVSLVAIGLTLFWFALIFSALILSSSNPKELFRNFVTFFNPSQGVENTDIDFLETDGVRHNPEKAERYFLSGVKNFDKKDFKTAITEFRIAIKADPAIPKMHFEYARTLLITGQWTQGEQSLRKTIELDPKHVNALLTLAEVLERKEARAEAVVYAGRALEAAPEDRRALRMNAALLASENQPERVRELLDRLVALEPEDPDVLSFAARLEMGLFRNLDIAKGHIAKALELDPNHVDALMASIPLFAQDKQMDKVDATLAQVLKINPDHLEALRNQADLISARYGLGAGLRAYNSLISRFGGDLGLRLRYAELLLQSGNISEGKKWASQLTGSRVASVERSAHWMLAQLYAQLRMHEEAAQHATQTLLKAPGTRNIEIFLAQQLLSLNRPGEAKVQLEKALALRQDDPALISLLTQAMVNMGQQGEAILYLRDRLKVTPEADVLRVRLTQILMQTPQWREALADTRMLQEKYPDAADLKNNLAFLLARAGQDLDRALVLSEALKAQFADNPLIMDTHAFVLAAMNRHEEALTIYEDALNRVGGNSTIRYHYARSLKSLGRLDDARRELHTSLMVDPSFPDAAEATALLKTLPAGE
jgi:tetratricopeptide (TPR) repeat protein